MSTITSNIWGDSYEWEDKGLPIITPEEGLPSAHFWIELTPSIFNYKLRTIRAQQYDKEVPSLINALKKNSQKLPSCSYIYEQDRRVDNLKTLYQFADSDSIVRFLQNKSMLIDTLEKIPINLLKYFFYDDDLVLETFNDPEETDSEYIQIKVITKSSVTDAFDRIEKFETEWFYENVDFLDPEISGLIFEVGYR
ncbi:MAG: hypothetical protein J7K40_14530 [candidate division Zixibacteria bacterium]|nr:hypothetical protein [candidate division Zixibacteria bacterium]